MLSNEILLALAQAIKSVPKKEYRGISVLCSACVPSWSELKGFQYDSGYNVLELAESFHSPAYDFSGLLSVVKNLNNCGKIDSEGITQIKKIKAKLGSIWSFNSTIHLSWTSEIAGLSNDLIGSITNQFGDYSIRYGVGWLGKSLEIREYHFGQERRFPSNLSGKVAYGLLFYPESDCFQGKVETSDFIPGTPFWNEIKKNGFMAATLEKLESGKI